MGSHLRHSQHDGWYLCPGTNFMSLNILIFKSYIGLNASPTEKPDVLSKNNLSHLHFFAEVNLGPGGQIVFLGCNIRH